MYKIYDISPIIMNEMLALRHQNQDNLRNWTYFYVTKIRTVNHGSENVGCLYTNTYKRARYHLKI